MQHLSPAVRGLKPPRITPPKIVNDKNGHELAVNCMAWSCDGHYLATGSDDRTVKIWQYKAAAATPFTLVKVNGSSILSSADEKDLDRERLAESSNITACAPITSLAFSPRHPDILAVASHVDGWQPAAHGVDGGLQGLQVVHRIGSREGRSIDQDRPLVEAPASRPRVTIWNIKTRQPITTILLSHNPVSMTFHPSSYQLLIVCMDKNAVDYAVLCWQQRNSISDAEVDNAYGSPLSREMLPTTGNDDGDFVPYLQDDTATGSAERRKRKEEVDGKQDQQKGIETDGDEGWTVRRDIELVLKDRVAEMKSYGFESGVSELNGACFSPCGTRLYTGNHDGSVHIWYYPVIPENPETIGASVSPMHPSTNPGLTSTDPFHHDSVETQHVYPNNTHDATRSGDHPKAESSASLPVVHGSTKATATNASVQEESDVLVGRVEKGFGAMAGDSAEVSNRMENPEGMKWLRHYETNQGCVNCIEMDPRRSLADGVSYRTLSSYMEEIKFAKPSWDGEYLAVGGGNDSIDLILLIDGNVIQRIQGGGSQGGGSRNEGGSGNGAGRMEGTRVRALAWSPARLAFVFALGTAPKSGTMSGHWSFVQL